MGKIAFVFAGQGDQYPGMGKDLYEKYPEARSVFDLCDSIRPGTSAQCFRAAASELQETRITQPCLFAMELAAASVLSGKGLIPDAVAGFSLGEVAAAAFSGIFDLDTGFRLVLIRGELMQREAEKVDASMAAVVKLTPEQVESLCAAYSHVYPVNYNCPGQISVSGLSSQMTDFFSDVKTAGGRAIPLKVKGAFHSPWMAEAAKTFANTLRLVPMQRSAIPLYANRTGKPYGDNAAELLSAQICHPVLWEKTIRRMTADGVDTFIEIGPGRTLTNMIRKISPSAKAMTIADYLAEVDAC